MEGLKTCRLLPYSDRAGPENMAADEALLAAATAGAASLRFYGWSEATLSLGYFQKASVRTADPRLASLPYVRRPSGGDTLVHHHEITYALALPADSLWQPGKSVASSWLCHMHTIIAGALRSLGVVARLAPPAKDTFSGMLCFLHQTAGDLLIGRHKVVGSAQRRQRGALLQHGGILLAASRFAPSLPGIRELGGRSLDPKEVEKAVIEEFARNTISRVHLSEWTIPERAHIDRLVQTKYTQPSWNLKR